MGRLDGGHPLNETSFEPETAESTTGKGHATDAPNVGGSREVLSNAWMIAGVWVLLCLVLPAVAYGLGRLTGMLGIFYEGGIGGTATMAGGFAAPFAVGAGWLMSRRRIWDSSLLHYGLLLLASLGAFAYGFVVLGIGGVALTLGHGELLTMMPLSGWEYLQIVSVAVGGLAVGSGLMREQMRADTLLLLGFWLVCAVGFHVFLADPNFHLFIGLAWGSGGALLLVFAAARPLHNQDRVDDAWRARVRYYAGAVFFVYGTLFLFLLAEGMMFALQGATAKANWPTDGGFF